MHEITGRKTYWHALHDAWDLMKEDIIELEEWDGLDLPFQYNGIYEKPRKDDDD